MQTLSNSGFLALWERGRGLHPLDQGLLALSVALPEVPPTTLADWPLGRKNRALIELHRACFSSRFNAWASCSRCGEKMEFELEAETLLAESTYEQQHPDRMVRAKGHSFRVPTSRDLAQAARASDPRAAALCLAESCRVDEGEPPVWSEDDLEEVGEAMAMADPLAETRVLLRCPGCDGEWDEAFDLATFVWVEIDARVRRLLREIHILASAYGWPEVEILALSDARRAWYVEMVQA